MDAATATALGTLAVALLLDQLAGEYPTALHPEIQRQVAHIRTDLDGFSNLEISSLVQHGYCVGRKTCRARLDAFGVDLPRDAPWTPRPAGSPPTRSRRGASAN